MDLAEIVDQPPVPMRWSVERFMSIVEAGIIPEKPGVELHDGEIVEIMPQGELHQLICWAMQLVFAETGAIQKGLRFQPTLNLDPNVFEPEFALFRAETFVGRGMPTARDILWVIEVSVSSRSIDLGTKKQAYAKAGIPEYWVVDASRRGVCAFSDPIGGDYRGERFYGEGESLPVPAIGGMLAVVSLFPKES